jgi:hypothetical protein
MRADLFTKYLATKQFKFLLDGLMVEVRVEVTEDDSTLTLV